MIDIAQGVLTSLVFFWIFAVALSLYYGVRGIIIQIHAVDDENKRRAKCNLLPWKGWERAFVHCAQDFIYNFTAGLAGFAALHVLCELAVRMRTHTTLNTGMALLFVFLSLLAITGISGKLPELIHLGRFPGTKM